MIKAIIGGIILMLGVVLLINIPLVFYGTCLAADKILGICAGMYVLFQVMEAL